MSTAQCMKIDADTSLEILEGRFDSYRLADETTDLDAIDKTEVKPKSTWIPEVVRTTDDCIERIKQIWSGVILECDDQEFTARLEDKTNPDNPDEIVVLDCEEIEVRDRGLIEPGASFLWHIGYRFGAKYPRERFSKISLRRLPKWSSEEVDEAEVLAEEYNDFFS